MAVANENTRYLAEEGIEFSHTCTSACNHGDWDDALVAETGVTTNDADWANDLNLDDYGGYGFSYRGKPIADLDQVVEQIDSGTSQQVNAGTITFTFLDQDGLTGLYNSPKYNFRAAEGLAEFTDAQKDAAREAVTFWDDIIAPTFVEKKGNGADIQFANSTDPGQAYAYYPEYGFTNARGFKFFGDIFVDDPQFNGSNGALDYNGYGLTTLVHELGHAIGLSHPGSYNGPSATNYAGGAEYAQDSEQYSIMSYWAPSETGARLVNWDLLLFGNAQTPMLHDVYVAQQKYGADMTTRTGDTVYGFNSTAGRDVFDFDENHYPALTIWDAGGNDTLDFSGFGGGSVIDLRDGHFSSGGVAAPDAATVNANRMDYFEATGIFYGATTDASIAATAASFQNANANSIARDWGVTGIAALNYNNISIAYGADIENAIGTAFDDVIVTNELDNVLTGGDGADTFIFLSEANRLFEEFETGGDDVITDFEVGVDRIDLSNLGIDGNSRFAIDGNTFGIDVDGDGVIDQSITFENLETVPFADIFA